MASTKTWGRDSTGSASPYNELLTTFDQRLVGGVSEIARAAGMLNVAHKITIGSATLTSGKTSRLLDLETDARPRRARQCCSHRGRWAGADVSVQAGRHGQGGTWLRQQPGSRVHGHGGAGRTSSAAHHDRGAQLIRSAMTTSRFNAVYAKQSAGEIAGDLMGRLKVSKSTVDNGEKFASYAVSDRPDCVGSPARARAVLWVRFLRQTPNDKAMFTKYSAGHHPHVPVWRQYSRLRA